MGMYKKLLIHIDDMISKDSEITRFFVFVWKLIYTPLTYYIVFLFGLNMLYEERKNEACIQISIRKQMNPGFNQEKGSDIIINEYTYIYIPKYVPLYKNTRSLYNI